MPFAQEDLDNGRAARVEQVASLHKDACSHFRKALKGGTVSDLEALKPKAAKAAVRMAST